MIYFSNNIRYLRSVNNIDQLQLSKIIDVKRNSISNYENGISTPSYDKIIKIVEFFDISIDDLLKKDLSKNVNLINKKCPPNNNLYRKNETISVVQEDSPPGKAPVPCQSCAMLREIIQTKEQVIVSQQEVIEALKLLQDATEQKDTK